MRWLVFLITALLAPMSATAATASDPAFLGIGMLDAPPGCRITSITVASPAKDAGLRANDLITGFDGVRLAGPRPCTELTDRIVSRHAGDKVTIDVLRGTQRLSLKATLSTRGDVLNRRFVGEEMLSTEVQDFDTDELTYDLSSRGRTRVVGMFRLDGCNNCSRVFDTIADGLRKRLSAENTASILAVTAPGTRGDLTTYRKSFTASVPLAVAEDEVFETLALNDSQRISFMVIDCRGVVRFVAPIAPDADDLGAAVDDILAATEQAEHQRTRRN